MMRLILFLFAVMVMSACQTWQGIKKDLTDIGHAIGDAAEKAGKALKEATE